LGGASEGFSGKKKNRTTALWGEHVGRTKKKMNRGEKRQKKSGVKGKEINENRNKKG